MVMRAGLSKEMGPVAYGENEEEVFLGRSVARQQNMSEETARKVDSEIRKFVDMGYDRARKVLTEKIDDLHKLAKALLTYETLTGAEIEDLVNKNIYPTTIGTTDANKYGCLLPIEELVLSEIDPIIGSVNASKNRAIAMAKPASPGSRPTTFP